jgi:hypothetical protein
MGEFFFFIRDLSVKVLFGIPKVSIKRYHIVLGPRFDPESTHQINGKKITLKRSTTQNS